MRRYKSLPTNPIKETVAPIPVTAEFYHSLQTKFRQLKQTQAEVKERLQTAREMGDLSENGAYKYAKFELGSLGRQLGEIRHLLDHGVVTAVTTGPMAGFGSTVTLKNLDTNEEKTYQLLSEYQADPKQGSISMTSPLGKLVVGTEAGDKVELVLPRKSSNFLITQIR